MKNSIVLLFLMACTSAKDWFWGVEQEAPPAQQPAQTGKQQFDDFCLAGKYLREHRWADAFEALRNLSNPEDQISFLKNFYHINQVPHGCPLTIAQLQQLQDAQRAVASHHDATQVHVPQAWKVHLAQHTK